MAISCTGAQISFRGYGRRRMATTARSQPCALPISEECSHGVGVAPVGVEGPRSRRPTQTRLLCPTGIPSATVRVLPAPTGLGPPGTERLDIALGDVRL
jgi:hypothetical protein